MEMKNMIRQKQKQIRIAYKYIFNELIQTKKKTNWEQTKIKMEKNKY